MKELENIIKTYYYRQVTNGKGKKFDDCNCLCIPIAQIPVFLKSKNIEWRDYGFDKLTELIQELEGISLFYKGVPYIYLDDTINGQNNLPYVSPLSATNGTQKSSKNNFSEEPKAYEIRNAYRKMAKNPEDWVHIVSLMKEVGWTGKPTEFTTKYKLQYNSSNNSVRVHNISRFEMIDDIFFRPRKK